MVLQGRAGVLLVVPRASLRQPGPWEACRHTVCGCKVSWPLDFPTTYAQQQLCFDSVLTPLLTHHPETGCSSASEHGHMKKLIDGVNLQHVIYSMVTTQAYTLLLSKMQGKKV